MYRLCTAPESILHLLRFLSGSRGLSLQPPNILPLLLRHSVLGVWPLMRGVYLPWQALMRVGPPTLLLSLLHPPRSTRQFRISES